MDKSKFAWIIINGGSVEKIICHVCKEQIEERNNVADENEPPICLDCDYKILNQDNYSIEDDIAVYNEYGWKYKK